MRHRHVALVVLAGALALLGASIAWAVDSTHGDSWAGHHFAYGPGMMGLGYSTASASPVSGIPEARQRAQSFADRLGLKTGEVLRFDRNYYVKLVDEQGANATEVLVDPETGATSIEYGPAMMWNTTYGMLSGKLGSGMMSSAAMQSMMGSYGGMMGGGYGDQSGGGMMGGGMMGGGYGAAPGSGATGSVSIARAHVLAQEWLDANQPGVKVEPAGDAFPGYTTLETLRNGKIDGMISVNSTTGAVWSHWWHGRFVERAG